MEKNAVMYFNIEQDHKFRGLSTNIILPCTKTATYEAAFNELEERLASDKMVNHVIDGCSLLDDLFDGDETYKFKEVKRNIYGLVYVFVNSQGDELEHEFMEQFVTVFN